MHQRVLVNAGACGIGREIARPFPAIGAALYVCDVDAKALEALAQEITGVETTVCDLLKRQDIERMMGAAVSALPATRTVNLFRQRPPVLRQQRPASRVRASVLHLPCKPRTPE
jgi:short-subunit dehydrogenase involved in D-alanine esterification of teichoic acids